MSSPFSRATTRCLSAVRAAAGTPVTYARGNASVNVTGVPGTTEFENETGDIVTDYERRDFMIEVAVLILDGDPVTPQRGDRITDNGEVYEVLPRPDGPVFGFSDRDRTTFRINTRRIESE